MSVLLFLPLLAAADAGCTGDRSVADGQVMRAEAITPASGRSWLHHLGLSLEETRMGQAGGGGAPPDRARNEPSPDSRQPFAVSGEDLYRLDCRACHGPDGTGAPPEVNSLIQPVEGTSPTLLEQRMKQRGRTLPPAFIATLTAQAEQTIGDRLQHGGQKMPAFSYLKGNEVNVLLGYLKTLAKVPDAPVAASELREPAALVGEHLVKGTCHICHDATGPGMAMMMSRNIPSLASLPEQWTLAAVEGKVIYGRSPMGGMMGMMTRARMPVFSYLTGQEVGAAYLYLRLYAPR
jgi:mono/diheme cytochrome c family protein